MRLAFIAGMGLALVFCTGAKGKNPDANTWMLKTSDTVLTVCVSNHQEHILSLNDTSGSARWLHGPTRMPLLESLWIGSRPVTARWQFHCAVQDKTEGTLRLAFTNAEPNLMLHSVWRARAGRGPIQHWVEIENRGAERVTVSQQESLFLAGLAPGTEAALWWIRRGGASATTQGGTYAQPLGNGADLVLTNNCDWGFGDSPVPWLAVQVGERHGLYMGWEFSGLGRVHAKGDSNALNIAVGLWPEFKTDVDPGTTLKIPPAFVGCYAGDIEEGSYSLHRFIIEKLRPPLPKNVPDPVLTYNLYLDNGMTNATTADVCRSAKFCAELGFEAFMPDAMWYPEVGDWRWDPRRFPDGMRPVRDYVRQLGLRQALWCAWSNGGKSQHPDALNVFAHQDWFSTNSPSDWVPGPHYGAKLCFGSPGATEWAKRKTQSLVREHQLHYLKHDSDPIVNRCLQTTHLHRHSVDASYWSTLGYYSVQEALLTNFPHLIIEDCSGGGHIKDFGIIQRTHLIATTDMLSNLADRQSMYDTTFAFPPLMLQCYTYDNYWPVKGDHPGVFLWRSAMMGAWHIDPTDTAGWSDEEIESARQSTRIYKNWIRPMLKDVKVHHVLPRADGNNWDGLFFWSAPLKRGTFFVFRPNSPEPHRIVKLKGLANEKRYWVWSEDGSVKPGERPGQELMREGLSISLTNRFTCDLVYVREAGLGRPEALDVPGRFRLRSDTTRANLHQSFATLHWNECANARDYRVTLSEDREFRTNLIEKITSLNRLDLQLLPPGRMMYWRVEARSLGGTRWSSNTRALSTAPLPPKPSGIEFASDMPWSKANAGADNSVRRDQNIHGRTLRLGREYYPKGIWTHAFPDATPADVVIGLAGRSFQTFHANVGLEDSAGRGSVQFQVLVDGTVKTESPIMRLGAIHPIQVPVAGAKQVTLRVLNGGDGYACDHAVWADAQFLSESAMQSIIR